MSTAVGIDLGTSYCSVAAVRNGRPEVLRDDCGQEAHPSVVAFLKEGGVLVGHPARARMAVDPFSTIYSAKRLIGRRMDDPETNATARSLPYKVVAGPNDYAVIEACGHRFSIPEVSAYLLRQLKQLCEARLQCAVDRAVIAVPANFNDSQRESTRIAGRIAGLEVTRIINEPTAAALAYGYGRGLRKLVAVYDFGGGTFDFTVMEIRDQVFRVIATAGDMFLGGDDFDEALANAAADSFWRQTGVDLRKDVVEWQRLLMACEQAKRRLSVEPNTDLHIPKVAHTARGVLDLSAGVTRQLFNSLCFDLVRRSFAVCERALNDAHIRPDDIEDVVLVGGSSYIPLIRASVEQFFGKPPRGEVSPVTAVALGAAIQAYSLMHAPSPTADREQTILLDVLPQSIGIVAGNGLVQRVLDHNMSIPVEQSRLFTTCRANQKDIRVKVVQGESERADENTALGELIIDGLRPAPRGDVQVIVTFEVDTNGILKITARDRDSGRVYRKSMELSRELDEKRVSSIALRSVSADAITSEPEEAAQ